MKDFMEPIQVTLDRGAHDMVLKVCVCGKHENDSVPIRELLNAKVCIYYVDEKDDIIKRWNPNEKKNTKVTKKRS